MKLTKTINIETYEVLADYKVKVEKSPFIAILKFAEEQGGQVYEESLYDKLLKPLSKKACANILDRLTNMGYFKKEFGYEINYYLTELGWKSAEQEEFYEQRKGVLRIKLVENEFIEQKVVEIEVEELKGENRFEEEDLINVRDTNLNQLISQDIVLENGRYILDKIEGKCRKGKKGQEQLSFVVNEDNCVVKVLNFRKVFRTNREEIIDEILEQQFREDYLKEQKIIKTEFNPQNSPQLSRNIEISEPKISNTFFNPITISDLKFSPGNLNDAKKWFKALVTERINEYFLSEEEFEVFANKIANEFDLYKKELTGSISRKELVQILTKKEDFYKKAKLETIDYLTF